MKQFKDIREAVGTIHPKKKTSQFNPVLVVHDKDGVVGHMHYRQAADMYPSLRKIAGEDIHNSRPGQKFSIGKGIKVSKSVKESVDLDESKDPIKWGRASGMHTTYQPTKKQGSKAGHIGAMKFHKDEATQWHKNIKFHDKKGNHDEREHAKQKAKYHDTLAQHHAKAAKNFNESIEVQEGVGAYSIKKTGKHTERGNDEYEADINIYSYDILQNGKKVGELERNDYFGYVKGHLHGKDLPELSGYGGKNRNAWKSGPIGHLHAFLKSNTGKKWASTGKLRGRVNEVVDGDRLAAQLAARKAQRERMKARGKKSTGRVMKKATPAKKSSDTKKVSTGSRASSEDHIIMQLRSAQDVHKNIDNPKPTMIKVGPSKEVELKGAQIDKLLALHDRLPKPEQKRKFRIDLIRKLRKQ